MTYFVTIIYFVFGSFFDSVAAIKSASVVIIVLTVVLLYIVLVSFSRMQFAVYFCSV